MDLSDKKTNLTISQLTTKRKIKEIILHCSATAEGKNFHASDIDRWHKAQGWKGIGYNYVIDLDGTIEIGRSLDEIGAHTTGHNSYSIGICYIGGVAKDGKTAKDTRTADQKIAMYSLLHDLLTIYPNAEVHCHYEFAKKACPSFKLETLQREYQTWLRMNDIG